MVHKIRFSSAEMVGLFCMYELFFCCYERIPQPEATKEEYIWADSVDVSLIAGETWQRVAGVGH